MAAKLNTDRPMATCLSPLPQFSTDTPSLATRNRPEWFPDWDGEPCVIIASGPSAVDQPIDLIQGRARTIAINNSWKLAPWSDVLYGSDCNWWASGQGDSFKGLKVSRSNIDGIHKVELVRKGIGWVDDIIFEPNGTIGAGGTGAFQALNLAVQFGCKRIALIGVDARLDLGEHWHGKHTHCGNSTDRTAEFWRDSFNAAAPKLLDAGILVTNCSPVSAITAYEKMDLETWLG